VFAEDGEEYEADLTEIRTEDCGNKSATVVFVGYGNVEQVWLDDLLDSKPEERKAAMKTVQTGDFCRVVYQGTERPDLCGSELEGMVFSVDGDGQITVRILGVHSLYQKVQASGRHWRHSGLKDTGGSGKREEQIMRFRNEKTTPAGSKRDVDQQAASSTTVPSLSTPINSTDANQVQQQLEIIQELVNSGLMKRVMSLEATNQALVEQCDVIRSGNMNLLQQLQANSKAVEVNGKITDTQYQDTIKVFAKNLEHEKQRYEEMERKYAQMIETNLADQKALLAKVQQHQREVLLVKQEKQELLNENITLKAKLVK